MPQLSTAIAETIARARGVLRSVFGPRNSGINSPTKDINGTSAKIDTKTGFDGELAIGHYFLPAFATELGVGYFESKGTSATKSGEANLKVVSMLLTAKGLLPMGEFEPFGELGIGAYFETLDVSGALGNFDSSTKGVFGLHAGAGVNFNISQEIFLGFEGRYLWVKPSFGFFGQDIKMDGFTLTAGLGHRF